MGVLPKPGDLFGRYRIEAALGQGGMGVVLAAVQVDLGRRVALKLLAPELVGAAGMVARFRREAQALARLDSPHVVQVYDAGEHDGWVYIATQLVPDGDLADLVATRGPLPPRDALELTGQVLSGLADAHAVDLLHRDVKPSNVLLRHETTGVRAYLCDFGIAQALDLTNVEKTQGIVGTWAYLAPERFDGALASAESDIYAVGCLLWYLVTGALPYTGTMVQLAIAHQEAPIPQFRAADPVAVGLNDLFRRSMAKRPEDRFASALEMQVALRAVLAVPSATPGAPATVLQPTATAATVAPTDGPPPVPPPPVARPPATDPHQWATQAATDSLPDARRSKLLLAVVGTVVVIGGVVGGLAAFVQLSSDEDRGSTSADGPSSVPTVGSTDGSVPEAEQSTEPVGAPSRSMADGEVRCWNGDRARTVLECDQLPTGREGMAWVFPSLEDQDCRVVDGRDQGVEETWTCTTSLAGSPVEINYNRWSSNAAGDVAYDDELGARMPVVGPGGSAPVFDEWNTAARGGHVWVRLFRGHPYSVEVRTTTRYTAKYLAAEAYDDDGHKLVRFRPYRRFAGDP